MNSFQNLTKSVEQIHAEPVNDTSQVKQDHKLTELTYRCCKRNNKQIEDEQQDR